MYKWFVSDWWPGQQLLFILMDENGPLMNFKHPLMENGLLMAIQGQKRENNGH